MTSSSACPGPASSLPTARSAKSAARSHHYRLTIRNVLAAAGPGRFSLSPSQQEPFNAYVPLDWLQQSLDRPGKVNELLLSLNDTGKDAEKNHFEGPNYGDPRQNLFSKWLDYLFPNHSNGFTSDLDIPFRQSAFGLALPQFGGGAIGLKLDDLGLRLTTDPRGFLILDSENMIIERQLEETILASLRERHGKGMPDHPRNTVQPVFTYLANSIADDGRTIPYSTVTAIDFAAEPPLGPFLSPDGKPLPPLGENEIALNSWAADNLKAKIGDTIVITFFAPESVHGKIEERTAQFKLAAIVQLKGAGDDRDLTPKVKGVTDELTMADWDPPFPFDAKRIRSQDEKYWNLHGPTPKAFVSLAAGRKLWGSRFGQTTSLRIALEEPNPPSAADLAEFKEDLESETFRTTSIPYNWQPIRTQALSAAQGTTPFNVLFLCFSFFIIVSALMLVLLLFKLGVERRAAEIGILLAVGWEPKQVRRLLFREGVLVALAGGLIGVPVGIGYAALMLWGLQTWWLAAIVTPFLNLYIWPGSLLIGFFAGFFMAVITIYFAVRRISRIAPRQLLSGATYSAMPTLVVGMRRAGKSRTSLEKSPRHAHDKRGHGTSTSNRRLLWIDIVWLIFFSANLLFWFFARRLSDLEAGLFFGSGALMLVATLLVVWNRLRRGATGAAVAAGGGNLFRLALRNAARNPGRSTLTIGLVASACFLIVAVSAFQLDPSQQSPNLQSGNGGFALVAESSQPIFQNLDAPDGREALGISDSEEKTLSHCRIYALRVHAGDDASCLNLYQPRSPRILRAARNLYRARRFRLGRCPAQEQKPLESARLVPANAR